MKYHFVIPAKAGIQGSLLQRTNGFSMRVFAESRYDPITTSGMTAKDIQCDVKKCWRHYISVMSLNQLVLSRRLLTYRRTRSVIPAYKVEKPGNPLLRSSRDNAVELRTKAEYKLLFCCHSRKRSASGIGIQERQTADSGQAGMTNISTALPSKEGNYLLFQQRGFSITPVLKMYL